MKVVFWGASVTQQSGPGGYYDQLEKLVLSENNQIEIERFGFGGNSFDDAGFYCAHRLIETHPDVCFFEFSTTFLTVFDTTKLHQFLHFLTSNNVLPVFLILPRVHNMEGWPCISQQERYAKEFGFPILDLRQRFASFVHSVEYLRDGVHTTELGALFYAKNIFEFMISRLMRSNDLVYPSLTIGNSIIPIHKFSINKQKVVSGLRIKADFSECSKSDYFELIAHLRIGPMSNFVNCYVNSDLVHTAPIFDQWTHYERDSYKPILSNKISPDYSRVYGLNPFLSSSFLDAVSFNGYIDIHPAPVGDVAPYAHINRSSPEISFLGEIYSTFKINSIDEIQH